MRQGGLGDDDGTDPGGAEAGGSGAVELAVGEASGRGRRDGAADRVGPGRASLVLAALGGTGPADPARPDGGAGAAAAGGSAAAGWRAWRAEREFTVSTVASAATTTSAVAAPTAAAMRRRPQIGRAHV